MSDAWRPDRNWFGPKGGAGSACPVAPAGAENFGTRASGSWRPATNRLNGFARFDFRGWVRDHPDDALRRSLTTEIKDEANWSAQALASH
jgi:hypothetical protein